MATTVADLIIKITVQFKEATKGINTLKKDMGGLKDKFATLGTAAKVAWAIVGAAVISGVKASVKAANLFEKDLTELGNVTGKTFKQLANTGREIQNLSSTFGVASHDISHGLAEMARLGYDTDASLKVLPQILRYNIATGSKFKDTIGLIETTLKDFKKELKDVDSITDIFTATLKHGRLTTFGLSDAFSKAGLSASIANASVADLAAAVSLMAQKGVKASTAGVALQAIFKRLTETSGPARKAIEGLGVKVAGAKGKLKPFGELIDEIRGKFQKLSEQEQLVFLNKVGGQHGGRLGALLRETKQSFVDFSKELENSKGKTKSWFDEIDKTAAQSSAKLDTTFEAFKQKFGKSIAPLFTSLADTITAELTRINAGLDVFNQRLEAGETFGSIFVDNLTSAFKDLGALIGLVPKDWREILNETDTVTQQGLQNINNTNKIGWSLLKDDTKKELDTIKSNSVQIWGDVRADTKTQTTDMWRETTSLFKTKAAESNSWGFSFMSSFGAGLQAAGRGVISAARSVASKIASYFKSNSPPKEGPLSTADKWMPNFMGMLASGIEMSIPKIQMAVGDVASSIAVLGDASAGTSTTVNVYPRQSNLDAGGLTRELQRVAWLNGGVI